MLQDAQLQQIVDKTIMEADKDGDGKLSFEEFSSMVANTVRRARAVLSRWKLNGCLGHRETDDAGGSVLSVSCS
jgi:hypothetical protein